MGEGAHTSDSSSLGLNLCPQGRDAAPGWDVTHEGPQSWWCGVDSPLARPRFPLLQSEADVTSPTELS